jgi:transposase
MEGIVCMSNQEITRLEVMGRLRNKSLKQNEAALMLGVSVRQIKRIQRRYKQEGAKGLVSKKRGMKSNHQLSEVLKKEVLRIIKEKYWDFGPTLAHEKLVEQERLKISVGSVRNLMITHEIWIPKKVKRKRIFQLRERRKREGELIQVDGSEHGWFEERGPRCTLLVYIDDATGHLKELRFVPSESIFSYFSATRVYLTNHGRPLAFYSDKHAVFRINREEALSGTGLTQFGRAMKELDIQLIYANTPQAKGRVERTNKTLQDRLVKELRLLNISTIEEANAFLPTFLEEYNRRFAVIPKSSINAHRPLLKEHDLEQIFTIKQERHLSKNLTIQYKNIIYQIISDRESYALRGAKVMVIENEKEEIRIFHKKNELEYCVHHLQEKQGEVVDSKRINPEWERFLQTRTQPTRSRYHPWKKSPQRPIFKP